VSETFSLHRKPSACIGNLRPASVYMWIGCLWHINVAIEEDYRVFMAMVHPVNPHHFVCASRTVSGRLAEALAKNSKPKGFEDIVLMSLHIYADIFSEMAFNSLPECRKWDHTIELECEPSCKGTSVRFLTSPTLSHSPPLTTSQKSTHQ
jgi:hypothetical protein